MDSDSEIIPDLPVYDSPLPASPQTKRRRPNPREKRVDEEDEEIVDIESEDVKPRFEKLEPHDPDYAQPGPSGANKKKRAVENIPLVDLEAPDTFLESMFPKRLPRGNKHRKIRKKIAKASRSGLPFKKYEDMIIHAMVVDVESLLRMFNDRPGSSFSEFASVFSEKEFSTIFLGRYTPAELIEYSEVLLSFAATYMLAMEEYLIEPDYVTGDIDKERPKYQPQLRKDRPLKERLFGVFLTYCLFFTQPQDHIGNIKVTVEQMNSIREFCERDLIPGDCKEALFCINRLVDNFAFTIIPFEKEFNPVLGRRWNAHSVVNSEFEYTDAVNGEPLANLRSVHKDFTLLQTELIHKRYVQEKTQLKLDDINLLGDSLLSTITDILHRTEAEIAKIEL